MDRFFSVFGKIALGAIALGIILGLGYYIGQTKIIKYASIPTPMLENPKVSNKPQLSPTTSEKKTTIATPIPAKKTLNGGLSSGTSFSTYSIQVPTGWTDKRETTPSVLDKVTLTKEGYSLIIYQAAIGGGGCIYKGDPPTAMSQSFNNFVDITGTAGQFRRSWNADANTHISYTICQKGSDYYSSITQFGKIDVVSPNPADDATLGEIDSIIASLKKQ